ncbi:MAG: hypothetical protein RDU89_08470, partial [bacterium]|nr:hypothetical protein [bacterium]
MTTTVRQLSLPWLIEMSFLAMLRCPLEAIVPPSPGTIRSGWRQKKKELSGGDLLSRAVTRRV